MTVFTKKELHTQINNVDTRIALLKLATVSKEESEKIETELQELNASRNELLEKMKVVPEWRRIADAVPWAEGHAGTKRDQPVPYPDSPPQLAAVIDGYS